MPDPRDTIFALSSGRPPSAIAVVRVSGRGARHAITALAERVPEPRSATLVRLKRHCGEDPDTPSEPIDEALVLWFPGPRSETGEDTAEFHLHGGPAVIAAVLSSLEEIPGLRPAEAGEFTRRAFENGKLDLTRVEGLADLIRAETEAQRRQAFRHLKGFLGDRAERWRRRLTEALAFVEAIIDFPDEGIEADEVVRSALAIGGEMEQEIRGLLEGSSRGERLREGLTVTIAGPVNVGKSSILNRLAMRPVAIVSPHAGTTRDVMEVHLDLGGFPVSVIDTAGIRDTDDPVEEEGVRRARARANDSDLVLWVMDGTLAHPVPPPPEFTKPGSPPVWVLVNKTDLMTEGKTGKTEPGEMKRAKSEGFTGAYRISAHTGACFDDLVCGISEFAGHFFSGTECSVMARQRHRLALTECAQALERALMEGCGSRREEVIAEDLRLASRALGRLVGKIDVENVLDVIFRDFCIGK